MDDELTANENMEFHGIVYQVAKKIRRERMAMTIAVWMNPLAYGVDGLRGSLSNVANFGLFNDFLILAIITALLLVVGSCLFPKIQI